MTQILGILRYYQKVAKYGTFSDIFKVSAGGYEWGRGKVSKYIQEGKGFELKVPTQGIIGVSPIKTAKVEITKTPLKLVKKGAGALSGAERLLEESPLTIPSLYGGGAGYKLGKTTVAKLIPSTKRGFGLMELGAGATFVGATGIEMYGKKTDIEREQVFGKRVSEAGAFGLGMKRGQPLSTRISKRIDMKVAEGFSLKMEEGIPKQKYLFEPKQIIPTGRLEPVARELPSKGMSRIDPKTFFQTQIYPQRLLMDKPPKQQPLRPDFYMKKPTTPETGVTQYLGKFMQIPRMEPFPKFEVFDKATGKRLSLKDTSRQWTLMAKSGRSMFTERFMRVSDISVSRGKIKDYLGELKHTKVSSETYARSLIRKGIIEFRYIPRTLPVVKKGYYTGEAMGKIRYWEKPINYLGRPIEPSTLAKIVVAEARRGGMEIPVKERLKTLTHELTHLTYPFASEKKIELLTEYHRFRGFDIRRKAIRKLDTKHKLYRNWFSIEKEADRIIPFKTKKAQMGFAPSISVENIAGKFKYEPLIKMGRRMKKTQTMERVASQVRKTRQGTFYDTIQLSAIAQRQPMALMQKNVMLQDMGIRMETQTQKRLQHQHR